MPTVLTEATLQTGLIRPLPIAGAHLGERLAWVSLLGYGLFAEWGGSNMHPTAKRSLRICGILLGVMTKDDQ